MRPWAEFERVWETTEPTVASPGLHVVGLNSARPFRHQGGALSRTQLATAAQRLAQAGEGALRVVVLHHHLIGAPWRAARKRPVSRRNHVLRALVEAGAGLIPAGPNPPGGGGGGGRVGGGGDRGRPGRGAGPPGPRAPPAP